MKLIIQGTKIIATATDEHIATGDDLVMAAPEGFTPEDMDRYDVIDGALVPNNAETKAALREIDIASIRSIREFVAVKFADDPLLPRDTDGNVILATYETQAAAEREKLTVSQGSIL